MFRNLFLVLLLIYLYSCQTPIKGLPRPKIAICLIDVLDTTKAICGYDDKDEFIINSNEMIGFTLEHYGEGEKYINLLENKIRTYQRRCKK